jgi:hypothetical protein
MIRLRRGNIISQPPKVLLFKIIGERPDLVEQYESDITTRYARFHFFPHSSATLEQDSMQ